MDKDTLASLERMQATINIQQKTIENINASLETSLKLTQNLLGRVAQLEKDMMLNAL